MFRKPFYILYRKKKIQFFGVKNLFQVYDDPLQMVSEDVKYLNQLKNAQMIFKYLIPSFAN